MILKLFATDSFLLINISLATSVSNPHLFYIERTRKTASFFQDAIEETVQNLSFALLWIRMRTGSASFPGSRWGRPKACRSGSVWYVLVINAKHMKKVDKLPILYCLPQNVIMLSKILTNYCMTFLPLMRKIKHFKLAKLWQVPVTFGRSLLSVRYLWMPPWGFTFKLVSPLSLQWGRQLWRPGRECSTALKFWKSSPR
jgi:hypothetical protein